MQCAQKAFRILAPVAYRDAYPDEPMEEEPEETNPEADVFSEGDEDVPVTSEMLMNTITLGDPRLAECTHLFKPYNPNSMLKQVFCMALHKGEYTIHRTQKQNTESSGPQDAVKLYMSLKHQGKFLYEYTCTSSSAKKGSTKLSLGILSYLFGKDTLWKDLMEDIGK